MGRIALVWVASLVVLVPTAQAAQPQRPDGSIPAPAHVTQLVTHVPASTLNKVGAGDSRNPITSHSFGIIKGDGHFTSGGKPQIVTVELAWCPHCAANSWGLAVALSRFGTFSGLGEINTGTFFCKAAEDPCNLNPLFCFPFTHGLSFQGTRYRSPYVSFAAVELQDVNGHNLEKPNRHEQHTLAAVHLLGVTPAISIAGAWGFGGSGYDPATLAHMTWSQIAGSLADPHNRVARQVDGLANLFTAAICQTTNGRPGSVCDSRGVRAAVSAVLRRYPSQPPPPPPS